MTDDLDKDLLEFNPDAVELQLKPVPFFARATLQLLALLLVTAIVWASFAEIDRVVTASGKVVPKGQTIVIQPRETSVIKKIHVREGQIVEPGQPLVSLDPTFAIADLEQASTELGTLEVKAERLNAELQDLPFPRPENVSMPAYADQKAIYDIRALEFSSTMEAYEGKINVLKTAIESSADALVRAKQQHKMAAEIEQMYKKLLESKSVSEKEYLEYRSQQVGLLAQAEQHENKILETQNSLTQTVAEKAAYLSGWHSETAKELSEARERIALLKQERGKAQRKADLVNLVSNVRGVVLKLAERSEGSVLEPAEVLMTLVPLDSALEVEAEVAARDIGRLRVGDSARIKFEAFPFQKYGTYDGKVNIISGDAFSKKQEEGATLVYQVIIDLTESNMREVPEDFQLIPGMALQAEVKVGTRRVISYFLYPIMRMLDEGLRTP